MAPPFFKPSKYNSNLHQGARASTYEHARVLRHQQTEAEEKLWAILRNRQLNGKKFRRQHALGKYVVDFYCHECKLAIELDGSHHNTPDVMEQDQSRTAFLQEYRIRVLRFANEAMDQHPDDVVKQIKAVLQEQVDSSLSR
jgi:very-short-patch-repair endonuclease